LNVTVPYDSGTVARENANETPTSSLLQLVGVEQGLASKSSKFWLPERVAQGSPSWTPKSFNLRRETFD